MSLETVANTICRVRANLNEAPSAEPGDRQPSHRGVLIVPALKRNLDKVIAHMPHMKELTKDRMRRYFLRAWT